LNNYKLLIQYDGTDYSGWQIQSNAPTVQQKIVEAVEVITRKKVNLIGSGRTDSGVHAFGQVANFRIESELDTYKFRYSLNAILPDDISVLKIEKAEESFHSRFDAKKRSYIYLFSYNKSPFYKKYSYHYFPITKLDFVNLNKISKSLIGEHDFTSFSKKNTEVEDKICNISEILWHKGKEFSVVYITSNRFLHGMVRTMVGTILYAAENNLKEDYLINILDSHDREAAKESVPAKGLFLYKVKY